MSKHTREFIRDLDGFTGSAKLWRVKPPVQYGYGEDKKKTKYVVSSATRVMSSGPETYLFPADKDGEIIHWGELPGSYRGGLSHKAAMDGLSSDWD